MTTRTTISGMVVLEAPPPSASNPALPEKPKRGRPPGSTNKTMQGEFGKGPAASVKHLTVEDFSFVRGVISGMTPAESYKRFYANLHFDAEGNPVVPHGHTINAKFEGLKNRILKAAGLSPDPSARTLSADALTAPTAAESQAEEATRVKAIISFEEWYETIDPDLYRQNELAERYEEHLKELAGGSEPLPADTAVIQKYVSVGEKVRAINALQSLLAREPDDGDPISGWLGATIAAKLQSQGLVTLSQLSAHISKHGRFWHRTIKGLGPGRAGRIVSWIESHPTLSTPITRVASNWHPAPPLQTGIKALERASKVLTLVMQPDGVSSPDKSTLTLQEGFAPFELISVPSQFDGRNGLFRPHVPNLWGAKDDFHAVQIWLNTYQVAGRDRTVDAYRREVERFLGWLYYERKTALSSVSLSEALAYQSFLGYIPAKNISTKRVAREDPRWAPFRGQLSKRSQNYALKVLKILFSSLMKASYVTGNPFADVKPGPDPGGDKAFDATRSLNSNDLVMVRDALEELPGLQSDNLGERAKAKRTRLILHLLLTTGMRREELSTTTMSQLTNALVNGSSDQMMFKLIGKGQKERRVPVSKKLLNMIKDHHDDWKLLHSDQADRLARFEADPPLVAALESPVRSDTREITNDTVLKNDNSALSAAGIYQTLKSFFRALAKKQQDPIARARISRVSTHWMRHTFAHEVLRTADSRFALKLAQELLGHASINTTSGYIDQDDSAKVNAVKLVDPLSFNEA